MRNDIDKEFVFPPSRHELPPVKRTQCLVPFVLVLLALGAVIYFF